MKRPDARTALAVGAAAVTIALTAAAFWLSYEHLHDIASANGLRDPARAWAWPATVDLFIVAGELLILRASLQGRGMDWWAVVLAASGSLGSIALNVAGVGTDAALLEYVVAAVPPTAALIAFGALMRQVHEALRRIPAPAAPAAPSVEDFNRAAAEAVEVADPEATTAGLVLDLAPMPQPHPDWCAAAPAAGQDAHAVSELPTADADAALYASALDVNAAALAETGRPASLRRLQGELGIGQRRAQRIQRQLPKGA